MFEISDTGGVKLKHFFFDKAFEEGQKLVTFTKLYFIKRNIFKYQSYSLPTLLFFVKNCPLVCHNM